MVQFTDMTNFPGNGIFMVLYQLILLQHHNAYFNIIIETMVLCIKWYPIWHRKMVQKVAFI